MTVTAPATRPQDVRRKPTRVRFGIAYDALTPTSALGDDFGALTELVRLAEELGFDSVWFGETHRRAPGFGHSPQPLLLCAALAGLTTRIDLGTAVLLPPMYTPLEIAEQGAMVDQLSRGRLLLGVSTGLEVYNDFGWENIRATKPQLQTLMEECLELVGRFWTEPLVSYEGSLYRYRDAACVPRPWRRPHPPVYVGGITSRSIDRAARLGDGWLGGTPYPYPLMADVAREYREALARHGRGRGEFILIRPMVVAETDARAKELADEYVTPVLQYYLRRGAYIGYDRRPVRSAEDPVYRRVAEEVPIIGSPETCIRKIAMYVKDVGVDHFVLRVRFPGHDHAETRRHLRLLAREVLPAFRETEAT